MKETQLSILQLDDGNIGCAPLWAYRNLVINQF